MSLQTIELLKNWTPGKMTFPAGHTEKYDGVPLFIQKTGKYLVGFTRQGEVNTSVLAVGHGIREWLDLVLEDKNWVVGEVWSSTLPFQEISGYVRRKTIAPPLSLMVFDSDITNGSYRDWNFRRMAFEERVARQAFDQSYICPVGVTQVDNAEEAMYQHKLLMERKPDAEGSVIHSFGKTFTPGKRCWGTQRIKDQPTVDVRCVSFEEATSADGEPLGMVGRINIELNVIRPDGKTEVVVSGCGPGSLTHAERREVWANQSKFKDKTAEVKYMRDDGYTSGLRQPTFVRWRFDKR